MFDKLYANKTKERILNIIDQEIKGWLDERDRTYTQIKGYAESKDYFSVKFAFDRLARTVNRIDMLEALRAKIETMS